MAIVGILEDKRSARQLMVSELRADNRLLVINIADEGNNSQQTDRQHVVKIFDRGSDLLRDTQKESYVGFLIDWKLDGDDKDGVSYGRELRMSHPESPVTVWTEYDNFFEEKESLAKENVRFLGREETGGVLKECSEMLGLPVQVDNEVSGYRGEMNAIFTEIVVSYLISLEKAGYEVTFLSGLTLQALIQEVRNNSLVGLEFAKNVITSLLEDATS